MKNGRSNTPQKLLSKPKRYKLIIVAQNVEAKRGEEEEEEKQCPLSKTVSLIILSIFCMAASKAIAIASTVAVPVACCWYTLNYISCWYAKKLSARLLLLPLYPTNLGRVPEYPGEILFHFKKCKREALICCGENHEESMCFCLRK